MKISNSQVPVSFSCGRHFAVGWRLKKIACWVYARGKTFPCT